MSEIKYGKILEDGTIEYVDAYKFVTMAGVPVQVAKSPEELLGYKEVRDESGEYINITPYEYESTEIKDMGSYILIKKVAVEMDEAGIVEVNKQFMKDFYYEVPKEVIGYTLFAAKFSVVKSTGQQRDFLNDDLIFIIMGGISQQATALMMTLEPDYTKKFNEEYINSLSVVIDKADEVGPLLGYFPTLLAFEDRQIPSVI